MRFVLRNDTATNWASANPLLKEGEPGVEVDTYSIKFGDGLHRWNDLPYFLDDTKIIALIQQVVDTTGTDGGLAQQALSDHINAVAPHPVYDDMQSLVLLYQNAKV